MSKLGTYIKKHREKLGLSKAEFSRRMPEESRIGPDTLGKIENGSVKRPPDKRLEGFALVLNVKVAVLRTLLLSVMILTTAFLSPVAKSIQIIKAYEPVDGYHLAFSGGKDSIVIKALADEAGVKYEAHMALTTVDPLELLKFNKEHHPDLIYHKPAKTMFELIASKHSLPIRQSRFCCEHLKEYVATGDDKLIMQGIRAAESPRRAKREIYEIDNRSSQQGKEYLNPIFDWSDDYVWSFIKGRKIPYCSLYDEGFKRLGCVGCPLGSKTNVAAEFNRFPRYKKAYIKAIEKARLGINRRGVPYAIMTHFATAEEAFDWWVSQKSIKDFKKNLI